MGDRISLQFEDNTGQRSATLFSHWDGMMLVEEAQNYLQELEEEQRNSPGYGKEVYPLDRREAGTVMMDFLRTFTHTSGSRIISNYYLVPSPDDGDNGDNGHHIIMTNMFSSKENRKK